MMRKNFQLPEVDVAYLDELGLPWETVTDRGMQWVIVNNYPVISGYNQQNVSVAIKIETGYPRAPLDMAYFCPALQRIDGKAINAISSQQIDGKEYQRWSRHRTSLNPWREGIDDLSTHLALVNFWFEQEFIKKPNGIAA
jgi:hypothetical protein